MAIAAMKIALLTYSTKPRGSVVHTWELAAALHNLGHDVCVYALDKDGSGCDRSLPCRVRLIPAAAAPADIDALIRQRIQEFVTFLHDEAIAHDIYHAQDCIGANALVQLKALGQIETVVRTVHHIEDYGSVYLQQCQDKSIQQADLCLCVSDRWQQALQTEYGIAAPKVVNGVDQVRFTAQQAGHETAVKVAYGLVGSPIYLTVGGIEPRKNSMGLLAAFAQVLHRQPEAQLVIAGGATLFDYRDYREAFFAQARELQIEIGRSLILPGVIPEADLPALYRCGDVFCFPSTKEGWGLVVLEAIASGLPVVTANEPPFTEFLNPETAVLVAPDSVAAIAQGMLTASEPKTARTLVQNSQGILPDYTWERSAQQHSLAYQRLLDSR